MVGFGFSGLPGRSVGRPVARQLRRQLKKRTGSARQDEKHVPDLLEAIMRPTDPVKDELRQNLMKMTQFRPKIPKIRVSTFWIPGNLMFSRRRPMPGFSPPKS